MIVCPCTGVEHLLRNVKDATISTLASDVSAKLQALKGLRSRLADVQEYLVAVLDGRLPVNNDIMTYLQVGKQGSCAHTRCCPLRADCTSSCC